VTRLLKETERLRQSGEFLRKGEEERRARGSGRRNKTEENAIRQDLSIKKSRGKLKEKRGGYNLSAEARHEACKLLLLAKEEKVWGEEGRKTDGIKKKLLYEGVSVRESN